MHDSHTLHVLFPIASPNWSSFRQLSIDIYFVKGCPLHSVFPSLFRVINRHVVKLEIRENVFQFLTLTLTGGGGGGHRLPIMKNCIYFCINWLREPFRNQNFDIRGGGGVSDIIHTLITLLVYIAIYE